MFTLLNLQIKMKRLAAITMLLLYVIITDASSLVRYQIQCNGILLSASYDSLVAQIGVKEKTGKNDGYKVEQYLKSVGLGKGYPYCAAGQYWCFWSACKDLNLPFTAIPIYRTGSTVKMYNEGIKMGRKVVPKPKNNDLIFWRRPNEWRGHVERIIEVRRAGWVVTIGFNTSSGGRGSQDDGGGVFKRKRNIHHVLGRMVIRGFLGFKPI